MQREIEYHREAVCEHSYVFGSDEQLREAFSFDPYGNSSHMEKCVRPGTCLCQMCVNKIGIMREADYDPD